MRATLLALSLLAGAGCGPPKCNDKTVFVTLSFDAASSVADSLDVSLSLAGAPSQQSTVTRQPGGRSSTLQVDFGGKYVAGASFEIDLVARSQGTVVGAGSATHTLDAGCSALSLSVTAAMPADLSVTIVDLGRLLEHDLAVSVDAAEADFAFGPDLSMPDLVPPPDMAVSCTVPGPLSGALISDFESNSEIVNSNQLPSWFVVNDGTGTQSPPPGSTLMPATLTPSRGTSTKGIHTTGSGFSNFAQATATFYNGYPADAGAYSGLSFWAMGTTSNSNKFEVIVEPGAVEPVCGICTSCYDGYIETFTLTSTWTQYTVHWNDAGLQPIGYGSPATPPLDPHSISGIAFSMPNTFDVWFDDVTFIP